MVQERRLLAESGQISYASLLPVIEHLTEESSYLVVSAVSSVLAGISLFVDEGTETEAAFHELLKRLNRYNFERLGLEAKPGETEEDEKVRQLMIANMIKANDEAAKAQASAIFERMQMIWKTSSGHPLANLGQPNQAPGNQGA